MLKLERELARLLSDIQDFRKQLGTEVGQTIIRLDHLAPLLKVERS
jgi:hypothetical protein